MNIPLYLQYKNNIGDPWTLPTMAATIYPSMPAGALAAADVRMKSETATVTACGCPSPTEPEDRYSLYAELAPAAAANLQTLADFLLRYKSAAYQQAKCSYFGLGGFIDAPLSLLNAKISDGRAKISCRLTAAIGNAIAP